MTGLVYSQKPSRDQLQGHLTARDSDPVIDDKL